MTKTVASFEIPYTQLLDNEGSVLDALPEFTQDPAILIDLYTQMVQLRAYDTKAIALQRTGKMGTYASTLGQEAVSVGTGSVMQADDILAPFYRDYGIQLQRGVKMSDIYTYWGGDERGNAYPEGGHDMPISVPIASQTLHATGCAFALHYKNKPQAVVTTIGDGGTSEGDFYEAMNVAGAWNLPVVFLIINNGWAISVPLEAQTAAETLAQKGFAAGIQGEQVDGNDIIAMRMVMDRALKKARSGGGPTVIEALCYRLSDHTTADDASRYRSDTEVEEAWKAEPILRLRQYLIAQDLWDDTKEAALLAECKTKVDIAVDAYMRVPPMPVDDLFDHHYVSTPDELAAQKAIAKEAQ